MKYVIPIVGICVVAQYWVPGMAGVGGAIFILAVFHGLGELEKEKEVPNE